MVMLIVCALIIMTVIMMCVNVGISDGLIDDL